MAATCPIGFDVTRLHREVQDTYTRVATDPRGDFHFHRGPAYAAERLAYDPARLAALPRAAVDAFAGVGNPHLAGPIALGETVLDLGSGAGMDLLLSAQQVGSSGRAIGVEPNAAMRDRAHRAALEAGLAGTVDLRDGTLECIPALDGSIDVLQSNGVLNLATDKRLALAEMARVLAPGGRLHLADVVVERELSLEARSSAVLWAA